MRFAPFENRHAALILSWAQGLKELDFWASLSDRPTPAVFDEWLSEPDAHGRVLVGEQPVAYGELWISEAESEVELAHILVSPGARGQGVGRALAEALVEEARTHKVSSAWVRVVPANAPALRCYEAAGFSPVSVERERELNRLQPRAYRWLCRELSR
jgi:GNAT superfamily N-acetyltransferase